MVSQTYFYLQIAIHQHFVALGAIHKHLLGESFYEWKWKNAQLFSAPFRPRTIFKGPFLP